MLALPSASLAQSAPNNDAHSKGGTTSNLPLVGQQRLI
jgi:hypothetical protein